MRPDGKLIEITDPQRDRYALMRLIDWYDHERIRGANIMVAGAGALGNEVLKNLALLGIGRLVIVDFDTIEMSNLVRSVLFRSEDAGQPKAEIAAARVRALNPDVEAIPWYGDVTRDVGLGVFRRMDVVIGCTDSRSARLALNRACWRVGRPWVDGALGVLDGLVRVFIPPQGACYECTMTEQDYSLVNQRFSCPPGFAPMEGREPTTPMAASLTAAMLVQQVVRILHAPQLDGAQIQPGYAVYYVGETMRTVHVTYSPRDDCPAHETFEPVITLPQKVADLTIGRTMELVRAKVPGVVAITLREDVVRQFYCDTCERKSMVYRPYAVVVPREVSCPECGAPRRYTVEANVTGEGAEGEIPLTQLGIAPLDILPVRTENGLAYVEFGGDEAEIFLTR